MSQMDLGALRGLSMLDLFRQEVDTQSTLLTGGLLELERGGDATDRLEELMRVAHSLKGAARLVGRATAVRIAHAMEECLVAVQRVHHHPSALLIDALLAGMDLLNRDTQVSDEGLAVWEAEQQPTIDAVLASLSLLATALSEPVQAPVASAAAPDVATAAALPSVGASTPTPPDPREGPRPLAVASDRAVRVTTDNLNRLMGLAGEALMTSRWLDAFAADMLRLKRLQRQLNQGLERLRDWLPATSLDDRAAGLLIDVRERAADCQRSVAERVADLDVFDRRVDGLATRLYHTVLDCRMRPFSDGTHGLRRMARDVARELGKSVTLEITGETTPVDRDILDKLTAPLDHLVRNALDHGIESPTERQGLGKPTAGRVHVHACHAAGMLLISVEDDGRGVDAESVRQAAVERRLTTLEITQRMTSAELFEFLFLPGFTLKESVSEISGRGVGLDVVHTMAKEVGGRVRISSRRGHGVRFQLELPLTLSVIRTLLVEIGGEPYALPLARIDKALSLPRERIASLQGRQHFTMGDAQIGLVAVHQVLDVEDSQRSDGDVAIVVLGGKGAQYGLVIDRFLGEQELVVRALDPRLGKVKNISAAALMPDGSPVLIIDVDDLITSIGHVVSGTRLVKVGAQTARDAARKRKRVLVVDDSLTVRELERHLLDSRGYAVDVAVDGMDGWNAARTGHYDLIVTDVDMPRLDGIELITLLRKDTRLRSVPIMIVSYKDREEDRRRGLEAGANYYLTKASFHDETLLRVVADLIGSGDA
jgi:two-component system sensor histidine kinase and response regulator WspE